MCFWMMLDDLEFCWMMLDGFFCTPICAVIWGLFLHGDVVMDGPEDCNLLMNVVGPSVK